MKTELTLRRYSFLLSRWTQMAIDDIKKQVKERPAESLSIVKQTLEEFETKVNNHYLAKLASNDSSELFKAQKENTLEMAKINFPLQAYQQQQDAQHASALKPFNPQLRA